MKNKKALLETPPEEPVLLRGTSVEKVIEMLSTGRLVSRTAGNSERPADNGYMFFIPNKRAFEGHDFYDEIDIDYDVPGLEREAGYCARVSQQIEFLKQVFGDWPAKYHVEELEAFLSQAFIRRSANSRSPSHVDVLNCHFLVHGNDRRGYAIQIVHLALRILQYPSGLGHVRAAA